jgi:hypothetical protein
MEAREVVQVYFQPRFTRTSAPLPLKQLFFFEKVLVPAGATTTVQVVVNASSLATVDSQGVDSLLTGTYRIIVTNGAGQNVTQDVQI